MEEDGTLVGVLSGPHTMAIGNKALLIIPLYPENAESSLLRSLVRGHITVVQECVKRCPRVVTNPCHRPIL